MDNEISKLTIKSVESLPEYLSDAAQITGLSAARLYDIGQKCKARLDELKQARADSMWDAEKQRDFDSYHLVEPKKVLPYKGYPNLACPLPRIGVDTFHANVMFTFSGQNGKFSVLPDFLSRSHMDSAQRAAQYMTYVLNHEADLYTALDKADYDAEKYGNGYMKPRYVKKCAYETRDIIEDVVVPEIDELTGEVRRKTVKKKRTVREKVDIFNGVKIDRISPESVYVSPFFEDIDEAVSKDYVFEVQTYPMRYLNEMSKSQDKETPAFFSASKVKELKDVQRSNLESRLEKTKQAYDGFSIERQIELLPVELAEAHFEEDINDDGFAEKVAAVFETTTGIVLRISYAKCRIVPLTPRPVDGRWYGESIRKVSQPFITEWEAIHNQRVAKGQFSTLPFGFYKTGGRFNPQTLTLMPGKMYPMDDPSGVNFAQPPSPGMEYFQEEKLIMEYSDRVLALGDVIQGVQGKGDASATNTIHSQQRAGIRLSNPINRIAKSLQKLMDHIWDLNRQCAPTVKEFRVVGVGDGIPIFSKITSQDYANKVSFKLEMATMYDVQMLRDTALLNYQTFMSNPIFMQNPAAFYALTKETMNAVGLRIDIPKPPQAKVVSPFAEIDMVREGKMVEPVVGEDPDEHIKVYEEFMKSEDFKNWPLDAQQRLAELYDKTQMLKQTLEASNLNQSGIFEGMAPMPAEGPGLTATRNPSQTFNNMRVGETGPSKRANLTNGSKGNAPKY